VQNSYLERFGAYPIAIVATVAVVLIRWLLDPWLGDQLPFVTMFGAVAIAVWYGGCGPALLSTLVGWGACNYLFIDPRSTFTVQHPRDDIGFILYLFTCSIIIAMGEAMRIARRRAVQQSELLRVTFTSMGDAVISTDSDGRVISLNPVASALTGWSQEQAVKRPLEQVFNIVSEKTRLPVQNPVERVLAEGIVIGLANHTVLISKDGTERPIDDSAAPIKDAQGHLLGAVVVFRDVTERRAAERSARFLTSIVESSDDAIIGKDINGVISSWNYGAERLFGYSAAEIIGRPVALLAPPDRADEMPAILKRIRAGERIDHFDTVRRAKDGRLIPISLTVSPIKNEDGQVIGASKIARDISERKRAEDAIQSEKARLHTTLVSIGDAVIVTDVSGCITLMNPVAEALTGWKQDATGRQLEEVFHIINERTRQPVANPIKRVLSEGTVVGLANHTILIRKDGTEIPIDDSAAPISDDQGALIGCVLIFRDITARKRAEQALQNADRRKDEFLATLAHELRNPLAPILTAIELMQNSRSDPELVRDVSKTIERQIHQMVRLVNDLLDISRITQGKIQLQKKPVELRTVIQSAVEASQPFIMSHGHELTVTIPPEPTYFVADAARLTQVLANLLSNAAKYTENGGHIWLTAKRQDSEIVISVRDTGIGIAAKHLSQIFEMFSQIQPAIDRSHGGLGIGLSLVRGIVELHEGKVEAHSDGIGRGSEFIIRLPLSGVQLEPAPESRSEGQLKKAFPLRILVVDDNQDAADMLAKSLDLLGHETAVAYDGSECIQTAVSFRPAVVLLDIGLPKMNGYEVAQAIRQERWGKGIVIIALTGWGQQEDKRRALQAGCDHHLTKPIQIAVLERLLASVKQGTPTHGIGA
jgi:PAS domain S-box-containing protein